MSISLDAGVCHANYMGTALPISWAPLNVEQMVIPSPSFNGSPMDSSSHLNDHPDLPTYIKPIPRWMDANDAEYLRKKGVLNIPDADLIQACLQGYAEHIHPVYPLLDLAEVESIVKGAAQDGKLSLLLLHAITFAGCTWADLKLIRKLGFYKRREFRLCMYKRLRLLYDLDYEDDRLCVIQSLVLMTFWWKGIDEGKDAWHYLGIALSLARTIDLHLPVHDSSVSLDMKRLRRRIWWSLVTREVMGCFGLSRAPRIAGSQFKVSMLRMDDFEDFGQIPSATPFVNTQTAAQRERFARLCIEHAKLGQIFHRILIEACSEERAGRTTVLYSSQQIDGSEGVTHRKQLDFEYLHECEEELKSWRNALPDGFWHHGPLASNLTNWEKAEAAFKGLLAALYHTAVVTLHRPQMLPDPSDVTSAQPSERQKASRMKLRRAAHAITKVLMDFFQADLILSLSATCITCLIPASINHVFDCFSAALDIRNEAMQSLDQCKAILHDFSEQQYAPSWVLETLDHIMQNLRKHQPSNSDLRKRPMESAAPARYGHGDITLSSAGIDASRALIIPGHPISPSPTTISVGTSDLPTQLSTDTASLSPTALSLPPGRSELDLLMLQSESGGPQIYFPPQGIQQPSSPSLSNAGFLDQLLLDFTWYNDNLLGT